MKAIIISLLGILFVVLVSACAQSHIKQQMMMLGEIKAQALLQQQPLFQQSYDIHEVSKADIAAIKQWPSNVHIDVYLGTWCHDSQREVPRILKAFAENSAISYRLIALDINKTDPQGLALTNNITATPTIVVFQNNQEQGRIIEHPQASWVSDIAMMLVLENH